MRLLAKKKYSDRWTRCLKCGEKGETLKFAKDAEGLEYAHRRCPQCGTTWAAIRELPEPPPMISVKGLTHKERMRECLRCGARFHASNMQHCFCSDKCRDARRTIHLSDSFESIMEFVFERDDFTCTACGERAASTKDLHAHHVAPLYLGGADTVDNLTTLCKECHKEAHAAW